MGGVSDAFCILMLVSPLENSLINVQHDSCQVLCSRVSGICVLVGATQLLQDQIQQYLNPVVKKHSC